MPLSPAEAEAALFDGFRRLKAAWPKRGFSWDGRLSCVVSSFSVQFEKEARAAYLEGLPMEWTLANIAQAPPRIRAVATQHGEVRAGQILLTGGHVDSLLGFGLWWPWGNGETISLRVGLADVDAMRSAHARFRDVFGVTM